MTQELNCRYCEQPLFVVIKQPIPLDRLEIHMIDKQAASNSGVKNAFVLVHISRFQQIIALCLLQAKDESLKVSLNLTQFRTNQLG